MHSGFKYLSAGAFMISALLCCYTAEAQSPSNGIAKSAPSPKPTEANRKQREKTKSAVQTIDKKMSAKEKSTPREQGTSLLLSADLGFIKAFPSRKLNGFKTKTGLAVEGKALGNITLNNVIIDAGFGWFFYSVNGAEPIESNGQIILNNAGQTLKVDTGIKLSGTIVEVSPSYRFKQNYFAGSTVQMRFPSDLGYDSRIARKALGLYLGAQVGYQIFADDLSTRLVARLITPINYKDWLGLAFMTGVQVGLPFTR